MQQVKGNWIPFPSRPVIIVASVPKPAGLGPRLVPLRPIGLRRGPAGQRPRCLLTSPVRARTSPLQPRAMGLQVTPFPSPGWGGGNSVLCTWVSVASGAAQASRCGKVRVCLRS